MVAVVVHEMVAIAPELIAQLLDYPAHLLVREVGAADLNALPELKLVAQLVVVPRRDLEDPRKGEWVSAVGKLGAECLYAGVEYAQSNRGGVLVDPVLQRAHSYIYRL